MTSKNSNKKGVVQSDNVPNMKFCNLLKELNQYEEMPKLPVGVSASLAEKYSCSDRTVRRYFARVKNNKFMNLKRRKNIENKKTNNKEIEVKRKRAPPSSSKKKLVVLNDEERKKFVQDAVLMQKNCRLPKGSHDALAAKFKIGEKTVKRMWQPIRAALLRGDKTIDISMKKKGKCGRKKKNRDDIVSAIKSFHYKDRTTFRTLQAALKLKGINIALSTLSRIAKENKTLRIKQSRLKPMLTNEYKKKRFQVSSPNVDEQSSTNDIIKNFSIDGYKQIADHSSNHISSMMGYDNIGDVGKNGLSSDEDDKDNGFSSDEDDEGRDKEGSIFDLIDGNDLDELRNIFDRFNSKDELNQSFIEECKERKMNSLKYAISKKKSTAVEIIGCKAKDLGIISPKKLEKYINEAK